MQPAGRQIAPRCAACAPIISAETAYHVEFNRSLAHLLTDGISELRCNDNDNDTFREVPHLSMRAWPYRQNVGAMAPLKRICLTGKTCSVGKVQKSLQRKAYTHSCRWQSVSCLSFSIHPCWSNAPLREMHRVFVSCSQGVWCRRMSTPRWPLSELAYHSVSCWSQKFQVRSQLPAFTVDSDYVNIGGKNTTAAFTGIAGTILTQVQLLQGDPLSEPSNSKFEENHEGSAVSCRSSSLRSGSR